MENLVVPALYLLAGTAIYAGIHRLGVCLSGANPAPQLMFGLMSLSLAAYALAAVPIYTGVLIPEAIHYGKLLVTAGAVCWICLVWFVVFYAARISHLAAIILTCIWSILLLVNLFEPNSLVYSEISSTPVITPAGESILVWHGITSRWLIVLYATVFASLTYAAYIALQIYQGGAMTAGLMLMPGLTLLTASNVFDVFIDAGVVDFVYLSPFGLLSLVVSMGLYLSFGRWEERPAPPIGQSGHTVTGRSAPVDVMGAIHSPARSQIDSVPGHELEYALRHRWPESKSVFVNVESAPYAAAEQGEARQLSTPEVAGEIPAEHEAVDINLLIRNSVPHIKTMLEPVGGRLALDLNPDLPLLRVDRTSAQQVLMSLIRNAVDSVEFSGGAGDWDILIESRAHSNHFIELCISDSGNTVDLIGPEIEPIIHTLQKSGQASTAARILIAERIIYSVRGRIWYTQHKPTGSVYHVTLPCLSGNVRTGRRGS